MQMMEQSLTASHQHHSSAPIVHTSSPPCVSPLKILLHMFVPCSSSSLQLLHPVEGGACLEPFDLCLVKAVVQFQGFLAAVAVLHDSAKRLGRKM